MLMKMTVLYREGGNWDPVEVNRLTSGLRTAVCFHPRHPEHLIIFGRYTKEETLKALLGGRAYTATQVTCGIDNPKLPFRPSF